MVPAIGITVDPLPVAVPGGRLMLMEYVPLRAALEYMVCPETGGGFVMGFELELEPLEQPTTTKMATAQNRAGFMMCIDLTCMG